MKKLSLIKKIQLAVLILLSGASLYIAISDQGFYDRMAENFAVLFIYLLMWLVLFLGFLFLFLDFLYLSRLKNDYHHLTETAYSDHLSGIPNRLSCDVLLKKYSDVPAPEGIGCIMLEISNLCQINKGHGHDHGNQLIKDFSSILSSCANTLCFVGRNGGNKFLAIFEDCSMDNINSFLENVKTNANIYNKENATRQITYTYGIAINSVEKQAHIQDLIALANTRLSD